MTPIESHITIDGMPAEERNLLSFQAVPDKGVFPLSGRTAPIGRPLPGPTDSPALPIGHFSGLKQEILLQSAKIVSGLSFQKNISGDAVTPPPGAVEMKPAESRAGLPESSSAKTGLPSRQDDTTAPSSLPTLTHLPGQTPSAAGPQSPSGCVHSGLPQADDTAPLRGTGEIHQPVPAPHAQPDAADAVPETNSRPVTENYFSFSPLPPRPAENQPVPTEISQAPSETALPARKPFSPLAISDIPEKAGLTAEMPPHPTTKGASVLPEMAGLTAEMPPHPNKKGVSVLPEMEGLTAEMPPHPNTKGASVLPEMAGLTAEMPPHPTTKGASVLPEKAGLTAEMPPHPTTNGASASTEKIAYSPAELDSHTQPQSGSFPHFTGTSFPESSDGRNIFYDNRMHPHFPAMAETGTSGLRQHASVLLSEKQPSETFFQILPEGQTPVGESISVLPPPAPSEVSASLPELRNPAVRQPESFPETLFAVSVTDQSAAASPEKIFLSGKGSSTGIQWEEHDLLPPETEHSPSAIIQPMFQPAVNSADISVPDASSSPRKTSAAELRGVSTEYLSLQTTAVPEFTPAAAVETTSGISQSSLRTVIEDITGRLEILKLRDQDGSMKIHLPENILAGTEVAIHSRQGRLQVQFSSHSHDIYNFLNINQNYIMNQLASNIRQFVGFQLFDLSSSPFADRRFNKRG